MARIAREESNNNIANGVPTTRESNGLVTDAAFDIRVRFWNAKCPSVTAYTTDGDSGGIIDEHLIVAIGPLPTRSSVWCCPKDGRTCAPLRVPRS
jgi:hypothetical protein